MALNAEFEYLFDDAEDFADESLVFEGGDDDDIAFVFVDNEDEELSFEIDFLSVELEEPFKEVFTNYFCVGLLFLC